MTIEVYRLMLEHFIDDDGKRTRLEEPLVVQMACDRRYLPVPICINNMLEMMHDEIMRRVTEGERK